MQISTWPSHQLHGNIHEAISTLFWNIDGGVLQLLEGQRQKKERKV